MIHLKKWDWQTINTAMALHDNGRSYAEIAEELKITRKRAYYICNRYRAAPAPPPPAPPLPREHCQMHTAPRSTLEASGITINREPVAARRQQRVDPVADMRRMIDQQRREHNLEAIYDGRP